MTNYRRSHIAGACYFFTVNLADRSSRLLTEQIDLLRNAFDSVQNRHPFTIDAIVILPDHLHTLWTLPDGDNDFALRWRLIKTTFSRNVPQGEHRSTSRAKKGERGIWQRRYWEHLIRDEQDFARHADYIHINPVKHGWVKQVSDYIHINPVKHGWVKQVSEWPHSSFHRYVRAGILPSDWAGGGVGGMDCGERESA